MDFNGFILPLKSRVITACRRAGQGWLLPCRGWFLKYPGTCSPRGDAVCCVEIPSTARWSQARVINCGKKGKEK